MDDLRAVGVAVFTRPYDHPHLKKSKVFWFFFSKKNCFLSFYFIPSLNSFR
jgi:hypothetical protein